MIEPYKLRPAPPLVCLLDDAGFYQHEDGATTLSPPAAGYRTWASVDTIEALVAAGQGEALCWGGTPIRWRPDRLDEPSWRNRPTDVIGLHTVFPADPVRALAGLVAWRDWLDSEGASPIGTFGASSWSLLRAQLSEPLYLATKNGPPIRWTLGGRQQVGLHGTGTFRGRLEHWDMQAAYARTLGGLRYGGRWHRFDKPDPGKLAHLTRCGPTYVRGAVRVPRSLAFGPLPRRPKRATSPWETALNRAVEYPAGVTLRGVWTWPELAAAHEAGCTVKPETAWTHLAGGNEPEPFRNWLQAVERGREMPGFAGQLAKITGNALWGRFCPEPAGHHTILCFVGGKRQVRRFEHRYIPEFNKDAPLAEYVAGTVRARLYGLLASAGDRLVSAHTDGGWLQEGYDPPSPDWRQKGAASRLDLVSPQFLRYWPVAGDGQPEYVVAGVIPSRAAQVFDEVWAEQERQRCVLSAS